MKVTEMTGLMGSGGIWWRRRGWLRLVVPMAALVFAWPALGQRPLPPSQLPGAGGPPTIINPQEDDSKMAQLMRKERNVMRQKKMESQMRLLEQLTNELQAEAGGTPTEAVLLDAAKKTEQIEKLAKSIRELMIGPLS